MQLFFTYLYIQTLINRVKRNKKKKYKWHRSLHFKKAMKNTQHEKKIKKF